MSETKEGPRLRLDPRLIALVTVVAPLLLHWVRPWPVSELIPVAAWPRLGAGALLTAIGLLINVAGLRVLKRHGEDPAPRSPSASLISEGPFRWSRNPMYLGFSLFTLGLALLLDNLWLVGATLLGWLLVDRWVIPAEERYLRRQFGDRYLEYERRVRRWL